MDVVIVGAGATALSLAHCLKRLNEKKPTYEVLGFLAGADDERLSGATPIIGAIDDWQPLPSVSLAMGLASPAAKKNAASILKSRGAFFTTIIAPEALVGDNVRFGEGCVILTPFVIDCDSVFGEFVTVMGATVSLDGRIGAYSTLDWFANTTTAKIGKEVFVGSHAVILRDRKVGDGAYIEVGSIVLNDVGPGQRVLGYPARAIQD